MWRRGTGVAASAAGAIVLCVAAVFILQTNTRGGVVLVGDSKNASPAHAVRYLASLYAEPCKCAHQLPCECAVDSAARVRAALDNAVERDFAPPNMYYRSRDGYGYRLRSLQQPVPQRANRESGAGRVVEPRAEAVDYHSGRPAPKPVQRPGIVVPARFVDDNMSPTLFMNAHHRFFDPREPQREELAKPRSSRGRGRAAQPAARKARLQSLVEEKPELLMGSDSPPEGDEEPEYLPSDAVEDAILSDQEHGTTLVLDDGSTMDFSPLEGVGYPKATDSDIPRRDAAARMPHQQGQELDTADWEWAHSQDAIEPFRSKVGWSNFPNVDANAGYAQAALVGYGGRSGDEESYASFLDQQGWQGGEEGAPPDTSSVNGWLTDSPAY